MSSYDLICPTHTDAERAGGVGCPVCERLKADAAGREHDVVARKLESLQGHHNLCRQAAGAPDDDVLLETIRELRLRAERLDPQSSAPGVVDVAAFQNACPLCGRRELVIPLAEAEKLAEALKTILQLGNGLGSVGSVARNALAQWRAREGKP